MQTKPVEPFDEVRVETRSMVLRIEERGGSREGALHVSSTHSTPLELIEGGVRVPSLIFLSIERKSQDPSSTPGMFANGRSQDRKTESTGNSQHATAVHVSRAFGANDNKGGEVLRQKALGPGINQAIVSVELSSSRGHSDMDNNDNGGGYNQGGSQGYNAGGNAFQNEPQQADLEYQCAGNVHSIFLSFVSRRLIPVKTH
ncbi:hypothetical protein DL96DRAFT_1550953 [Flagelloscypha sp. PMI_526]|nr:hypothetical protein DL96DRAFT_1550953 [Flagelloscypha sp. PMI_526]